VRKPGRFDFAVTLKPSENVFQYTLGTTMVGCLRHDQIVWTPKREGWWCPVCGFEPRADAPPLVVISVDYKDGTVTVG
jgi:hypothetical protein